MGAHPTKVNRKSRKKGRPKGSRSKKNILLDQLGADLENGSVREIMFGAFDCLGGLKGLVEWGKKHPKDFYSLWARMGPRAYNNPGRKVAEPRRDAPEEPGDVEIEDFGGA